MIFSICILQLHSAFANPQDLRNKALYELQVHIIVHAAIKAQAQSRL
jgi:hypothetical protein